MKMSDFRLNFTPPWRVLEIAVGTQRVPSRGIGNSFQLAITTPRKILIGHGTAAAQEY